MYICNDESSILSNLPKIDHQRRINMNEENSLKDHPSSSNVFSVDYSKRDTSRCKVCAKVIDKDKLRIGKLVPFKAMHILRYFHVKCTFESFRKARLATNDIAGINDLDGYGKLGNTDKSLIKELIEKGNTARLKPSPQEPLILNRCKFYPNFAKKTSFHHKYQQFKSCLPTLINWRLRRCLNS